MSPKTKAGPVTADRVKSFADRVNNLLDEKQTLVDDVRDVYDEAKKAGVNTTALRKVIAKRRAKAPDPTVAAAMEAYEHALDQAALMVSNGSTSLRKAAAESGFSKSAIQRRQVSRREENAIGGTAHDADGVITETAELEAPPGEGSVRADINAASGASLANPSCGRDGSVPIFSVTDSSGTSPKLEGEPSPQDIGGETGSATVVATGNLNALSPTTAAPAGTFASTTTETPSHLCGCEKCVEERVDPNDPLSTRGLSVAGWRYACETCGNKRCPHHTDHRLACTGSNEPGQPGSSWENYPLPTVALGAVAEGESPQRVASPDYDPGPIPERLRRVRPAA